MKAQEEYLIRFLDGANKNFVIPVYQRNYEWKKEQCEQLYNDLISIVNDDYRTHFLGSVVHLYNQYGRSTNTEFLIIDGQQRLTTVTLLLLAIHNVIIQENVHFESPNLAEKIMEVYLINKWSNEKEKKIRLKPIKDDQQAFIRLFDSSLQVIEDSNITENYRYFYNRILKQEITIDNLFRAIEHLMIVEIELQPNDDPQLIFESLNSTGLDLTEADKVRNFILMKKAISEQEFLYNKYWNNIEKNTNYDVSSFIRHYLTLKERKIPNINKLFKEFKRYVSIKNIDLVELLSELLTFSKYYNYIINANSSNDKFNLVMKRLNNLENYTIYPFLLELYDDFSSGLLNEEELVVVLGNIESYVFRRLICSIPTNTLNKTFMSLGREIKRFDDYTKNYFSIFQYLLIKKEGNQRFPNDAEFKEAFKNRDVYNFKAKNKTYLFERLENYGHKEKVKVEELISENTINIEHIMPRKLTPQWIDELGTHYQEIHDKYLHTIGNLTLTGYNSSLSNRTFKEKKEMKNGFDDSKLMLNKYLRTLNSWGEKEILNRAENLSIIAEEIWEYPIVNYERKIDNELIYSIIDESKDFTGEKIEAYLLGDKKFEVDSWRDFSVSIINVLNDHDSVKMRKIIQSRSQYNNLLTNNISFNQIDLRKPIEIFHGAYIEGNTNTKTLLQILKQLIEVFDYQEEEIFIVLKSDRK
ncbi:uncharacterized protein with ParB-like and HNH nuclease domain [Neobacillus niacini]|uniref:DUF262 domain-containing protein n=1 Tax=Neobacillus driksii TaxID=3035913 RepID=UPI00278A8FD0|nr:DUF262 domain-containing protein [Neobacillus niacini]MDQ0976001.1 uncharacterized protein with ParB-like and HNH nuclease domain [Neobacillus niacini]